jgi:hypothetical protein
MTTTALKVGDKVHIILADGHPLFTTQWWPRQGVETTGTVQKVFKNGKVAVAVHQLRNRSEDGCHTLHFTPSEMCRLYVMA